MKLYFKDSLKWSTKITLITSTLAAFFAIISSFLLSGAPLAIGMVVVIIIILIGITAALLDSLRRRRESNSAAVMPINMMMITTTIPIAKGAPLRRNDEIIAKKAANVDVIKVIFVLHFKESLKYNFMVSPSISNG
jgi:hypothetical protein